MEVRTNRNGLIESMQRVQNIITLKSNLPILSYVLIQATKNNLVFTTTDLDIGITCEIPANIKKEGAVALPAKKFNDVIREFPGNELNILVRKNNFVFIEGNLCQFKLMGLDSKEFPKLPQFSSEKTLKLNPQEFKDMLSLVSLAVSFNETRYILNGVLFEIKKEELNLIATDGKRLAISKIKLPEGGIGEEIKIIIPIKTIHELIRNIDEECEVLLSIGKNFVLMDLGKIQIISRLIEGEFPNYEQVVPAISPYKVKIERGMLLCAIRRAALLSTPDYQAVKFEFFPTKGGKLIISKSTPNLGESQEELHCEYNGKETAIGFNPYYLIDVLKNLNQETVEIEILETEKPAVLRSPNYTYIVLPMRLG